MRWSFDRSYASKTSFKSAVASLDSSRLGTPPNTSLGTGSPASMTSSFSSATTAVGDRDEDEVRAEIGREELQSNCSDDWTGGVLRRRLLITPTPAAAIEVSPVALVSMVLDGDERKASTRSFYSVSNPNDSWSEAMTLEYWEKNWEKTGRSELEKY